MKKFNSKEHLLKWCDSIEYALSEIYKSSPDGQLPTRLKKPLFSVEGRIARIKENPELFINDANFFAENSIRLKDRAAYIINELRNNEYPNSFLEKCDKLTKIILSNLSPKDDNTQVSGLHIPFISQRITEDVGKITAIISALSLELDSTKRQLHEAKKSSNKLREDYSILSKKFHDIENNAKIETEKIIAGLRSKEDEIHRLVELMAGKSMSGSYLESSIIEAQHADNTRMFALGLMLCIVLIIGFSFGYANFEQFDWKTAAFRLFYSLAISIPAIYLARESTKHRIQQYLYRSTALELQALPPYTASLPEKEQHQLKVEMAKRIFGQMDTKPLQNDSYPINPQEIIKAIIAYFEKSKKSEDTEKNKTDNK